jgi:3-demethoxyubiquinol 3-hydroxylase
VFLVHLREQIDALRTIDPRACAAIEAIVQDEQSHHDRALLEPRKGIFWPRVLLPVISWATECVIWVGMRL